MENKKPDIHQMVNDLVAQITGTNKKEQPRTDSMRKNLDKLGDWTTKKSIPVHTELTKEEHNKLVMRANLELTGLKKRFNTMQSFLLAETSFADKLSAELHALAVSIEEMDDIINMNFSEEIQKDADLTVTFMRKRDEFLRRFQ